MAAEENDENIGREKKEDEKSPLLGVNGSHTTVCDKDWIACRYVISLTGMGGLMIVYALRVNLSVALVAMVNQSALAPSVMNHSEECPEDYTNSTAQQDGTFVWHEAEQGVILGSFFWGYIATQVIGGVLSARFGGKWLFGLGVSGTGALTLLTPIVAGLGPWYLVALRVLEGALEGVTFPAMYTIISKWSPPLERTIMVALTFSGTQSGTVLSLPLSGLLCQYGFAGGWPSVFYCFGTASLVWFVFYCVLVYEDPASHPRISQREKLYIQRSLGNTVIKMDETVPWESILTSVPVWALTFGFIGYTWCFYTLLTCLPLYLKEILRFNIKENGFVSALPYLVSAIVSIVIGVVIDKVRAQAWCKTVVIRKGINTIGLVMNGVLLIGVGLVGCDRWAAVALLTLSSGFGAFVMGGMSINHIELAPKYAGIVMGIANTGAQIPGILAPVVVGYFTNGQPTHASWMKVFYLGAGIVFTGASIFLFFGSCERQKWNDTYDLLSVNRPSFQTIVSDSLIDADRLRTVTNQQPDGLVT